MRKKNEKKSGRGILTRKERSSLRDYWRMNQRECREKRSSQKVRRKGGKDRKYLKGKKKAEEALLRRTSTKVDKIVQRLTSKLPADPDQYAEIGSHVIQKTTPRKKKALEKKGIFSSREIKASVMFMRELKSQDSKTKRTLMIAIKVMKKYRMLKSTSLLLGIQPSSVIRQSSEKDRKSRKNMEKEEHAINFYHTVAAPVPDRKSVGKKTKTGRY